MSRKVTIIGAGSVGSTITYTMAVNGLASEIVMIDVNTEKALGEAMDIRQGTPFCSPIQIYAGTYEDAKDSDVVIITSGMPRKAGQSRIDLAQNNVNVIKKIAPEIVKHAPDAIYLLVSNPVDILTYTFCKVSGLPENRILGSGTILDTARLRSRLAEYLDISQKSIHAYVMGEHGDSSFVPWSTARVGSVEILNDDGGFNFVGRIKSQLNPEEIEKYIR
ncbi:MAG: L-lactate dehydrogenase, partial [Christensenella sp.]